jgi:carbonic anhydrase/acetyltransferase-like protein (isoleucine patch superfamily)
LAVVLPFKGKMPTVAPDAYLAPTAVVVGNVSIGGEASVWFGAVLRGDHGQYGIQVGPRTNIQDNCVIHVGDWKPTVLGADVTVGHGAKFESCTIEDGCVIGMNAVILPEALIGEGSMVAAGSVVLEGTKVPPGSLVAGVPAKVRGSLNGSATGRGILCVQIQGLPGPGHRAGGLLSNLRRDSRGAAMQARLPELWLSAGLPRPLIRSPGTPGNTSR